MAGKKETKDLTQSKLDFTTDPHQTRSMDKAKTPSKGTLEKAATEVDLTKEAETPKITVRLPDGKRADGKEQTPEDEIPNVDGEDEEDTSLTFNRSRHITPLPQALTKKPAANNDPFEEGEPIDPLKITIKEILAYKILPFVNETELPNFVRSTNALQYYKVLRDLLFDWSRCKHHQKTLIDSALSDITPPGLRVTKQLEVIGSTPRLRLQALQIFSDAESKLSKVILSHYKTEIPKIESEFKDIYNNMEKINKDDGPYGNENDPPQK